MGLAVIQVKPNPRLGPPTLIGPIPFPVGAVDFNAQGRNSLRTLPPLVPCLADLAVFLPSGVVSAVVQEGHPSVEQDDNQCAPASVAAQPIQCTSAFPCTDVVEPPAPG